MWLKMYIFACTSYMRSNIRPQCVTSDLFCEQGHLCPGCHHLSSCFPGRSCLLSPWLWSPAGPASYGRRRPGRTSLISCLLSDGKRRNAVQKETIEIISALASSICILKLGSYLIHKCIIHLEMRGAQPCSQSCPVVIWGIVAKNSPAAQKGFFPPQIPVWICELLTSPENLCWTACFEWALHHYL